MEHTPTVVTVVSGLPRSGTSMMMQMLDAGGLPVLTDAVRRADPDNPQGYYEFEPVKQLGKGEIDWLADAHGKVVKIVSPLLRHLPSVGRGSNPQPYLYRVVFMHRRIDEILASQKQMLIRRGRPTDDTSDAELAESYRRHLSQIEAWLATRADVRVLHVDYNAMLAAPGPQVERINQFFDNTLDAAAMLAVVNTALYRQRL